MMKSKCIRWYWAFIGITVVCRFAVAEVAVTTLVSTSPTNVMEVRLELKNIDSQPFKIHRSELPWAATSGMIFVVIDPNEPDIPLRRSFKEMTADFGSITLSPHETIIGRVDLESRFPDLRAKLTATPLYLFWCFTPSVASPKSRGKPIGGFILLNKISP